MSGKVRMTRRVTFSSGHRYWYPNLSEAENRALFGPWASPFNHGHNYVLDVTVEGEIDPAHGMVVNIKRIDDVLRDRILSQFDQRSINDQIPHFADRAPSLENLLAYIHAELAQPDALPPEAALTGIRLEEMPGFYGELEKVDDGNASNPKPQTQNSKLQTSNSKLHMTLTRTYEFAASHRLDSPLLDRQTNLDLFGKCNNPAGHGHNYVLEVTVEGTPDPRTGMMVDLGELDRIVEEEVVGRYDHKNLNEDIPEFAGKTTTSEVVSQEIFNRLHSKLQTPNSKLSRIRLWETARNMFEVTV